MRVRIANLIDELYRQAARFLADRANGARGIFLRALGDTAPLMQSACIATGVVNVS